MEREYFVLVLVCINPLVSALKMCTSPTHLNSTQGGVKLPGVQMEVLQTEGIMTCAKQCLLRKRCKSVNFNTVSGECHLNRKTVHSDPSAPQLIPANNFVFSEIFNWPETMLGKCAGHTCPINSLCDPVDGSYVCRPTWCLGSPGINNGTFTSEPGADNESIIGTRLNYTCDRGYGRKGDVICQTNGSWSLGSCVPITSCAMVRQCHVDSPDREYWLLLSNFNNYQALIYCHNMVSSTPKEYLSFKYPNYGLFPNISKGRRRGKDAFLRGNCRGRGGKVWFHKIRVDITTMTVINGDKTFANFTNEKFSYGMAMDCYTGHYKKVVKWCGTKGLFTIDLRMTGWRVQPNQRWRSIGYKAAMEKPLISDNGTVVKLRCGGYPGGCVPKGNLVLTPFPEGIKHLMI